MIELVEQIAKIAAKQDFPALAFDEVPEHYKTGYVETAKVAVEMTEALLPSTFKKAPSLFDRSFAKKGMKVVCDGPDQHQIATFTKDVRRGDMFEPYALEFDGVISEPMLGTPENECLCTCGGRWFHWMHMHFTDGWR
jgi:hypothetical protein